MPQSESKPTLEKVRKQIQKARARFEDMKRRKLASDVEALSAIEMESRALADSAATLLQCIVEALEAAPAD